MSNHKSLSEITSKIGSGSTPRGGSESYIKKGVSFIRSQNVQDMYFSKKGLVFLNDDQADKLKGVTVQSNDIILNITGDSIARSCIVPEEILPARVNQHVSILRCNNKNDSEYVSYYIQFLKPYLLQICKVGGTRNALTKDAISNLKIKFPKDRHSRAKILTALNRKIELNSKVNTELEAMAKTLYDYWFVQFDFPNANGKPYKSSGGKMVYNEVLKREIPEGWEHCELGDHVLFKRGISYKSCELQETGHPFINLKSFRLDGKFKQNGIKFYTGKYRNENLVPSGSLVIAITDVTRNADIIGKAFSVPDIFDIAPLISCDVAAVYSKRFSATYLEKLFNSDYYHRYIKHFASGTLVLHLDLNGVKWFKTILPPSPILEKFDLFNKDVLRQRAITLKENKQLIELRDWLLPMLMNGQVKIS